VTDILAEMIEEVSQPDFMNPIHLRAHAIAQHTPAKRWNAAQAMHPAIFRALRLDRNEPGAIYAAIPFRLGRDNEGNAAILVALPPPATFHDDDYLSIETVLVWRPDAGTVSSLTDDTPDQLVGDQPNDLSRPTHVFAEPFTFFRAMAESRARWLTSFYAVADENWKRRPTEPRHIPGLLVLGSPDKVRWPRLTAEFHCHGLDPRKVNGAILRQSAIPRAVAANSMRIAA
jgi:hypothetical protein